MTCLKYLFFLYLVLITIVFCKPESPKKSIKKEKYKNQKIHILATIPQGKAIRSTANWFKEYSGATVQITEISYDETLKKQREDFLALNPQYDIYMIWYPELGDLVKQGILLDLTDWINSNKSYLEPEDFIPGIYKAYTLQNEKRYALPFDGDTHVLFYRKSLFEKHKIQPPNTWDEFTRVNKLITEKESVNGIYGSAIMCYKIPVLVLSSYMNRLGGFGGYVFDDKNKPSLDTRESISALSALVEQSSHALPSPLETNFEISRDAFLSGRVAMVEQWTDLGVMAEEESESKIKGDWAAVPMPKGNLDNSRHSSALNAGYALGISNKSQNIDLAKEFLLFATSKEIMGKYNMLNGGADPTRISILTSDEYKKFAPQVSIAAMPAITNAVAWPNVAGSSLLMKSLTENINLALQKRKTPEKALSDAQSDWIDILKKEQKK